MVVMMMIGGIVLQTITKSGVHFSTITRHNMKTIALSLILLLLLVRHLLPPPTPIDFSNGVQFHEE